MKCHGCLSLLRQKEGAKQMDNHHSKIMVATTAGDWEGIQHRPHHFAKRAAKSGRTVIYVEPPVSLIGPLKNRSPSGKLEEMEKRI